MKELLEKKGWQIEIDTSAWYLIYLKKNGDTKKVYFNSYITIDNEKRNTNDLFKEIYNYTDSEIFFLQNGWLKEEFDFFQNVSDMAGVTLEIDDEIYFQNNDKKMNRENGNYDYEEKLNEYKIIRNYQHFYGVMLAFNKVRCNIYFDKETISNRVIAELLYFIITQKFNYYDDIEEIIDIVFDSLDVLCFEIKRIYNINLTIDKKSISTRYETIINNINKKINIVRLNID